jgi:hypothetical protein
MSVLESAITPLETVHDDIGGGATAISFVATPAPPKISIKAAIYFFVTDFMVTFL